MTEKEICKQYNISPRTLLYYRAGGKVKNKNKNKKEYEYLPYLTKGEDWDISIVNNRSVIVYTEKGLSKIVSKNKNRQPYFY